VLSGCGGGVGGGTAISLATPFDDPARAREVASIYAAAKQRDSAALLALKKPNPAASGALDPAVTLALYVLNPATSSADFVAAYPTDARGVMLDYGSRLESAKLVPTGRRFPIDALADLAAKGDRVALGKLFAAFDAAGQPIAGDYGRAIGRVASLIPRDALAAVAELPTSQQLELTALSSWCGRGLPALLSVPAANDAQTTVQNEIRTHRAEGCPTPAPRKKRKKPHPRHKPSGKHKPDGKHKADGKHKSAPKHAAQPEPE